MSNNKYISIAPLVPNDKKLLINLLLSLEPTALYQSTLEPIIVINEYKSIVIIGVNYTKQITTFNSSCVENSFIIYILENHDNKWRVNSKVTSDGINSLVTDICCSADGTKVVYGVLETHTSDITKNKSYAYIYNYEECVLIESPSSQRDDMFGLSVAISRGGKRIYISAPMYSYENEKFSGIVYEYMMAEDIFELVDPKKNYKPMNVLKNTRIFSLGENSTRRKFMTCVGSTLELMNDDMTLCMGSFNSGLFSYKLNNQEELSNLVNNIPTKCTIDDMVELTFSK